MIVRIAKGEREEGQRKGTGIGAKGAERWRAAAQDQEPGEVQVPVVGACGHHTRRLRARKCPSYFNLIHRATP